MNFVKVAKEEGATLVCGGKRPEVSSLVPILGCSSGCQTEKAKDPSEAPRENPFSYMAIHIVIFPSIFPCAGSGILWIACMWGWLWCNSLHAILPGHAQY